MTARGIVISTLMEFIVKAKKKGVEKRISNDSKGELLLVR
jgi:hypothetical protein